MTFVDTNVFMYAVGRSHPLQRHARRFFEQAIRLRPSLATSAEVLQELLHAYLPVGRLDALEAAWDHAESLMTIWPIEADDVRLARVLATRHGGLTARDLLHLACCHRHEVDEIKTYDRALAEAWAR